MLPILSFDLLDLAYCITYSDYSSNTVKHSGMCERGEEISRFSLNVPARPRSDGFLSNLFGSGVREHSFSIRTPFRGNLLHNQAPSGSLNWWSGQSRPDPSNNRASAWKAGFRIELLIDHEPNYCGFEMYSEMLTWISSNSSRLDQIASKSSGYVSSWQEILNNEIEYLKSTRCPVIPHDQHSSQKR